MWGSTSDVHLSPLILLQKRIVRIITYSHYLAHTNPLFHANSILKIKDIYRYKLGIHMYELYNSGVNLHPTHQYFTRQRNNAAVAFQRLTQTQKSVSFTGPHLWNNIPQNIRSAVSLKIFKRAYRQYLIDKYAE